MQKTRKLESEGVDLPNEQAWTRTNMWDTPSNWWLGPTEKQFERLHRFLKENDCFPVETRDRRRLFEETCKQPPITASGLTRNTLLFVRGGTALRGPQVRNPTPLVERNGLALGSFALRIFRLERRTGIRFPRENMVLKRENRAHLGTVEEEKDGLALGKLALRKSVEAGYFHQRGSNHSSS